MRDGEFKRLSQVLFNLHPETHIKCANNILIYKCPGHGEEDCLHSTIVVVREISNNKIRSTSSTCRHCQFKKTNNKKSEERREANWDKQVATTSSTNWDHLNRKQKSQRRRKQAVENQRNKRVVARLKKELAEKDELLHQPAPDPILPEDEGEDMKRAAIKQVSTKFKDQMKHEMQHILNTH